MKVKYIRDVTSPPDRIGPAGRTRSDLPDHAVADLVHDGYVEIIEPETAEKGTPEHENDKGPSTKTSTKRPSQHI